MYCAVFGRDDIEGGIDGLQPHLYQKCQWCLKPNNRQNTGLSLRVARLEIDVAVSL